MRMELTTQIRPAPTAKHHAQLGQGARLTFSTSPFLLLTSTAART